MGKIQILTKEQKIFLDLIGKNQYFSSRYYFTGGTVLSEFYLQHRYSEDLDFFSQEKIEQEVVIGYMTDWSNKFDFRFESRFVEVVYRFNLTFKNKKNFKIDFAYYPHRRVEEGKRYKGIYIDSLRDIATNKFLTINQRTDAKDFVDLYFLLNNKYSFWDLFYSAEAKFKTMDFDILLLAQDLLKVEDFQALPKMIKPLTLAELKKFFREKAKELAKKSVIP